MVSSRGWCLVVLATIVASIGPAMATEIPIKGGPGGGYFRYTCAPGEYLVGFRLQSGAWIQGLTPLCAPLDNARLEPRRRTNYFGGPGGSPQEAYCQPDSFLLGISVTYTRDGTKDKYANSIRLNCGAIRGGPISQICMDTGQEGCDYRAGGWDLFCPNGEVATGVHGRHGAFIDALGFICGARPKVKSGPGRTSICKVYADTAVTSVIENKNLGCNYGGGRWTSDFNAHYNWCVGLLDKDLHFKESEAAARKNDLAACRAKKNLPTTGCNPPRVLYKNGSCGCPSGLKGANCDELDVR